MSNNNSFSEILKDVNRKLKYLFKDNLEEVKLFGSYARKDYDKDSDIDFYVLLNLDEKVIKKYERKVDDISVDLMSKYGKLVSLILDNSEKFKKYSTYIPFYMNVQNEGVIIWEKKLPN